MKFYAEVNLSLHITDHVFVQCFDRITGGHDMTVKFIMKAMFDMSEKLTKGMFSLFKQIEKSCSTLNFQP